MLNKSQTPPSDNSYAISSAYSETCTGSPEEEIALLFASTPPCLTDGRENQTPLLEGLFFNPLQFYDKHIDLSRILKRVVRNSAIQQVLCTTVDKAMSLFEDGGLTFPPVDSDNSSFRTAEMRKTNQVFLDQSGTHAGDVQKHYCITIGTSCMPVASGLVLEMHFPHWFRLLSLDTSGPRSPNYTPGSSLENMRVGLNPVFFQPPEDHGTPLPESMEITRKHLAGSSVGSALNRVNHKFRSLITYQFLPPFQESDTILRTMSVICNHEIFNWEPCHTSGLSGPPASQLPKSVDSPQNLFSLPATAITPTSEEQGRVGKKSKGKRTKSNKPGVTPSLPQPLTTKVSEARRYIETCTRLIQRAWSESVDKDTSIIVFRSGSYERIGVRERKTQILHLSELYDIRANNKLPYTKVHVGLFLISIRDAIQRAEFLTSLEESLPSRRAKPVPTPIARLPRRVVAEGSARVLRSQQQELNSFAEVGKRDLMLVAICHGNYNSPTPVSLFRTGKALRGYEGPDPSPLPTRVRQYSEEEYIHVVLHESMGKGATGTIHPGLLSAKLSDGSLSLHKVVLKLAFNDAQRTRIRNEYKVYQHLAKAGVEGILHVWGLFEDDAESVSALVLEHGGTSLRRLKIQQKMISPKKSGAFHKVLADINASGVTHGDLRPENLLIDDRGHAIIIDFDLAIMRDDKTPAPSEASRLTTMFEVYYREKNG